MVDIRVAILTVSDRSYQGIRADESGPSLKSECETLHWKITACIVVPDEIDQIHATLIKWCDEEVCDVILTTGGTGFAPRDVTPEATKSVIQREAPGMAEAMRASSMKITPHAMLSRGIVGIRKKTLIINLPGNPKGAIENLNVISQVIPHAIELLKQYPDSESGHRINSQLESNLKSFT
jgi:molybdopterin adenylyltransferase